MRTNLPVTDREFHFNEDATLMSATDTESCITYANAAFMKVSGFTSGELINSPHNMVRHPDMPVEAFADMWATLRAGLSWTALVKNRRKDGDHYWVRANATPVVRNGTVRGYMSVRTKPTPDEVLEADKLYRRFAAGEAGYLEFHKGLVLRSGVLAWTSAHRKIGIAWRLRLGLLSLSAATALMGIVGESMGASLLALLAAQLGGLAAVSICLERQIVRPLREVQKQALAVAAGQPAVNGFIHRVDEIGMIMRAITQSGLNLRSLVDDVAEQVAGLRRATGEIADGADNLSQRTETAAASLQETASSMEEISGSLIQTATSSQEVAELAAGASGAAEIGSEMVNRCVDAMKEIGKASERMADIVSVIDSLSFQTNILALNAAVEAARAGEHGKGFQVVTDEVRKLAKRSAESAAEIRILVNDNLGHVDKGMQRITQAGGMIKDIAGQAQCVTSLVEQISRATKEQSLGVSAVRDTLAQLDATTQQNAALVDESKSAANSVHQRAERLAAAVNVFRHR